MTNYYSRNAWHILWISYLNFPFFQLACALFHWTGYEFGYLARDQNLPECKCANTTFVSGKTRFKKIATDCVCSELLKYIICWNLRFIFRVFLPLQFTGQHSSCMNALKLKIAFFTWTFLSLTRFYVSSDTHLDNVFCGKKLICTISFPKLKKIQFNNFKN